MLYHRKLIYKIFKSVTIPKSVTSIGWRPFDKCNALETVYCYKGTVADSADLYNADKERKYIGDVNNDKSIDNVDAAIILKYAGGMISDADFTYDRITADADENGEINMFDSVAILNNIK